METEIRETLASLKEDRDLVDQWIWRENGEPVTLDVQWGRNNPFHNAIALYSAVNKAIHMKLFTLSTEDRAALLSRCGEESSNICKLADSFM